MAPADDSHTSVGSSGTSTAFAGHDTFGTAGMEGPNGPDVANLRTDDHPLAPAAFLAITRQ